MSVNGIPPAGYPLPSEALRPPVPGGPGAGSRAAGEAGPGSSAPLQRPEAAPAAGPAESRVVDAAAPSRAPEGVDPALWGVLTTEERAFFARSRALGPLTYGPRSASSAPPAPAVGGRVDVRV